MSEEDSGNPAVRLPNELSFDLDFPPLPRTMAEVTELVEDPDQDKPISVLKEIVASDPVVAPMVIQRVNSAFYGLRKRVETADQAVVLLGFEEVHRLVVTASLINLRSLFEADAHLVVYRQIMRQSIATALFARLLAEELHLPRGEMAYTAGLLHAVGRLVLLYNVPESYEALWGSSGDRQVPSAEDERAIFGSDYASLGAAGAEHWNLSSDLRDLIQHHPRPDRFAEEIPEEDEERADLVPLVRALRAARDLSAPYARILDEEVEEEDLEAPESLERLLEHRFTSTGQLMNRVAERREEIGEFVRMVLRQR